MKSALALLFLSTFAFASHGIVHQRRSTSGSNTHASRSADGWVQAHSGTASFTKYSGCSVPSCGILTSGFTAAVNELAFGAHSSSGDACGRCFKITSNKDPYSPSWTGPFKDPIVVRVSDLCPIQGNEQWCGQTASKPLNSFGTSMHFDLCIDSGAAGAFFPDDGRGALLGTFEEVPCKSNYSWQDQDGRSLWNGSCMAHNTTSSDLWPAVQCGNHGTPPQ